MIRLRDVRFGYTDRPVFSQLSLTVNAGEMLGIIGPNGSGKTTLLKLLRGTLPPAAGSVELAGTPLPKLRRRDIARKIAVVPQSAAPGYPFPVDEFVAMGRYPWKPGWFGLPAESAQVREALRDTDTLHLAAQKVDTLSGGELQRVLLARALVQQAPILLLDEASSHLDLDHRLAFTTLLTRLNRERGVTLILVSHDLDQAAASCHRLLLLTARGEVAAHGTPAEVCRPEILQRAFGVRIAVDTNPYTGTPRMTPLP